MLNIRIDRAARPLVALFIGALCCSAATVAADDAREARRRESEARRAEYEARRLQNRQEREAKVQARQDAQSDRLALCERIGKYLSGITGLPSAAPPPGRAIGTVTPGIAYEAWLFQDALFVPAFGTRYDQVSSELAERLKAAGTDCKAPPNAKGQQVADSGLFRRAFTYPYDERFRRGVASIRARVAESERITEQLKAIPPGQGAADRFLQLAAQRQMIGSFLLPGARSSFDTTFRDTYQRVVAPAQSEELQQVARDARGIEGLRTVAVQRERVRAAAAVVGAAPTLPDSFTRKFDSLVAEVEAAERQRIDALGDGIQALELGVVWRKQYDAEIGKLDPKLAALRGYFQQRRAALLEQSRPQLVAAISATRSEQELGALMNRYLPLPGDQDGEAGAPLGRAAAEHRSRLHQDAVLARNGPASEAPQSARSVAAAPRTPESAVAPSAGEPSEREMLAAFQRQIDALNEYYASTIAQCNRREYRAGSGDPMLAMQCLTIGAGSGLRDGGRNFNTPTTAVSRFQKIACEKAEGKPGYFCDYVAGIQSTMTNIPPSFDKMIRNGEMRQGRFVRQGTGWLILEK